MVDASGTAATELSETGYVAAILAADVAGYSRLMGADEEGTLERLKALHRELLDPKIVEHHGRIVKTTGDGMLVEFASVVDAVRCAVAVQQAMPERNTSVGAISERTALTRKVMQAGADVIAMGDLEPLNEIGGAGKQYAPAVFDKGEGKRCREMALATARWPRARTR